MSNSPAWDDINPAAPRPRIDRAILRDAAMHVRRDSNMAVELILEGQIDRARSYLQQAIGQIEDLK